MIEIHAKLLRGPVYFPDETIQCLITLRNVPLNNNSNNKYQSNDNNAPSDFEKDNESISSENSSSTIKAPIASQIERLCWTNVQLHCFLVVDDQHVDSERLIKQKTDHIPVRSPMVKPRRFGFAAETASANDTSFHECLVRGEKGMIVYSSKPKILFCDLQLSPGERQTFVFTETLPAHLNPSYSSPRVKYVYKLTIGAQRIGSAIRLFKIPIRVLRIDTDVDKSTDPAELEAISREFESENQETTPLDLALHRIEMLTCQKSPHSFNITSPAGKVAKFFIFKRVYRVGEDIVGSFNFFEGLVPCVRFVVSLICEETLVDEYRKNSSKTHATVYYTSAKCQEFTLNLSRCEMILPIPFHVTPTFSNSIVSVKWKLHFRFSIPATIEQTKPVLYNITEDGENDAAPRNMDLQVLTWDFPIRITPTHPSHVARGFQMVSSGTMNI